MAVNGCHPGHEKGLIRKRARERVSIRLGEQNQAAYFILAFTLSQLLLLWSIQKHTCSPKHTRKKMPEREEPKLPPKKKEFFATPSL